MWLFPAIAGAQDALLTDTFNRTTGLGSKWQVAYGAFTTDGTHAVSGAPPSQGNWAALVPALGTNDYAVSADISVPAGSLYSGVVARSASSSSFDKDLYAAQLDTTGLVKLYRRNGWTWTLLASTPATVTVGTSYNVKLVVTGSTTVQLEVWLDGVQKLTYADSSASRLLSGIAGIHNYNVGVKYKNVRVETAAPRLFSDAFNRTTGLGASWQTVHGSFTTDGTYAISGTPPGNGNWARVVPALGTNDYAVSANLIVPANSVTPGLVARSSDSTYFDRNLYAAQLDTTGAINLYRRNDWSWTKLATVAETITAGTTYNLKLIVSGSNPVRLSVWINGTKRLSYDDSSASRLLTGAAGLQNYNAGVKYARFAVESLTKVSVPFVGPGAGTVSAKGMSCTGTCDLEVPKGTVLALQGAAASPASAFGGFTGDCLGGSTACTLVADQNKSVTANMDTATVTIDVLWNNDKGDVTCNPECYSRPRGIGPWIHSVTVPVGTPITVSAIGLGDFEVSGWTGLCETLTSTCSFTATQPGEVRANFSWGTPVWNTVTLRVNGPGTITGPNGFTCTGTCNFNAPSASYQYFTATPSTGFVLQDWTGSHVYDLSPGSALVYIPYPGGGTETTTATFVAPTVTFPCGDHPCARGEFPPGTWRPYGPESALNKTIPSDPPLMYRSAEKVLKLLGDVSERKQIANFIMPADGLGGWPTYYGTSSDVSYFFRCTDYNPTSGNNNCDIAGMTARVPAGAQIQGNDASLPTADRHLTIIDQTTGREFDLWRTHTNPIPPLSTTIEAQWGGYTMAMSGDGRKIGIGEGTASGLGNLAGRIRLEEFQAAIASQSYINHALTITVDCTNGEYVYPSFKAERTCAYKNVDSTDAPPLGARLWLDMSFTDINALPAPEWKKVILRTLSRYGAIVNDTGTSFYFTVQTEAGNQYTSMGVQDAWLAFAQSLHTQGVADISKDTAGNYTGTWRNTDDGIDWTEQVWKKLKFVHPCVSDGTCNP